MITPESWGPWSGIREWPWDVRERPRPRTPHPEPALRGQVGDWLAEYGITIYPQAPAGWRLTQYLAEGNGIHSGHGRPTAPVRSLLLAYFHTGTARGATVLLHFKAGARKGGDGSWRFAHGFRWNICTETDCDHDRRHLTADGLREASADEIKALLKETPERTETT